MTQPVTTHILLADDDNEDHELFKEFLAKQAPDIDVVSVWNGQEALSYLASCPDYMLPHVIILDYKMPILNGPEVLDRLAREPRYAAIPRIVWSTSNQQEYIDVCLKKGASFFFTKPNTPAELTGITEKALSFCHRSI